MSKIRGLFFSIVDYAKSTSTIKAILLTVFLLPIVNFKSLQYLSVMLTVLAAFVMKDILLNILSLRVFGIGTYRRNEA